MKLSLFSILMLSCFSVFAQDYTVKGIVKDSTQIIAFSNVILTDSNGEMATGTITKEDGSFNLTTQQGTYTITVSFLGYQTWEQTILANQNIDLGVVVLTPQDNELDEVVVTAKKPLIERKVDRLVFNVENSIAATGGDAIDVLRNTPTVRIQNETISIIGKGEVLVMIDDHLQRLSSDDLTNFLKSIPSDNIKSIEVITTPPAKYDAEGNSGLINIKLKKAKHNSFSGSIGSSFTQATYPLASTNGGVNYQKGKLTLISNVNYVNGSYKPYQRYTIYYPQQTWREESTRRNFQNNLSGRLNLEYKISPKVNIGAQYNGVLNKPISKGSNVSVITDNTSGQIDSTIVTPSKLKIARKSNTFNIYSMIHLDSLGKQISFDANYFGYKSDTNNDFYTDTYWGNGEIIPEKHNSANNISKQNIEIYTSRIDITMPLKWARLTFGGKVSFIDNYSNVKYFNKDNEPPSLDTSRSNAFKYQENMEALYFSIGKNLSKKWELQLGLRFENTRTNQHSITLNQIDENHYSKFFPTTYLTYTMDENNMFSINYGKRIHRPSYKNLNPFRFYSSAYNYSEGNPFLQPYYTHNIEASYIHKGLYTSLSYGRTEDGIDQVTYVSTDSSVQRVFPDNIYNRSSWVFFQGYNLNKWAWWFSDLQLSMSYTSLKSRVSSDLNNFNVSFVTNNSLTFNEKGTLRGEFNFMYQSPSLAGSYSLSEYYTFDSGVKYQLLNKRLQLSLMFFDVFRSRKLSFQQVVGTIQQENFDYHDSQKVRLSILYRFGESVRVRKQKYGNEEEKSRI